MIDGTIISVRGSGDASVNGDYTSGPFDPASPHSLALTMRPSNWERPGTYFLKVGEEDSYFPHRIAWWPPSMGVPTGWFVDQGVRALYWHPGGTDGNVPVGQWQIYTGPRSDPGIGLAPYVTAKGEEVAPRYLQQEPP